jgi:hypothetical protein
MSRLSIITCLAFAAKHSLTLFPLPFLRSLPYQAAAEINTLTTVAAESVAATAALKQRLAAAEAAAAAAQAETEEKEKKIVLLQTEKAATAQEIDEMRAAAALRQQQTEQWQREVLEKESAMVVKLAQYRSERAAARRALAEAEAAADATLNQVGIISLLSIASVNQYLPCLCYQTLTHALFFSFLTRSVPRILAKCNT